MGRRKRDYTEFMEYELIAICPACSVKVMANSKHADIRHKCKDTNGKYTEKQFIVQKFTQNKITPEIKKFFKVPLEQTTKTTQGTLNLAI